MADDERLLALAAHARAGQQPTFLFMGAVHYLAGDAMASFTPATFTAFCLEREETLRELLETRLVQTNAVPRSLALRLGLTLVDAGEIHLVEVGASAGIHLRLDRYGYAIGDRRFGDATSPVQIHAEHRGGGAVPDLDAIPRIASTTGVDLSPVDARDAEQRRWLEALVWPGNVREASLLAAALEVVAADPPPIVAGDAIDVLPTLELPHGEPRVAMTVATRMHVPEERRDAFDAAIAALAEGGPLWRVSVERPIGDGVGIWVRDPEGCERLAGVAGPRVDWIR